MSGWIAVKRGITQHPIFAKRPDRAFVWLWMLETAAYKDTRQDAGGRPVEVRRGQVLTSLRQVSDATGVGIKAIRVLIDLLKSENAIDTDTGTGRLLITICNYEKYQSSSGGEGTAQGTPRAQSGHTKETKKQIPTTSGASAPVDPTKVLFDAGINILGASGIPPQRARQMVGKWRKAHGDAATVAALGKAQREGAIEPVSFIEGVLRSSVKSKPDHPEIGEIRTISGVRKKYAGVGAGWLVVHD